MKFDIEDTPAVGMILMADAQRFDAVAVDPYQRKDGAGSFLVTWRGPCPACAQLFDQQTGTVGATIRRRCPACRQPRGSNRPVSGRRGTRVTIRVLRP